MAVFDGYTSDELNRVLSVSKWVLVVFAVLTATVGLFNQWVTDRIATSQRGEKVKAQQRLRASETELQQTKSKVLLLEEAAQPRTLSEHERAALINHLTAKPQAAWIIVTSKMLSPECNAFGEQICDAIVKAGWQAKHNPMAAVAFHGIRIVTNGPADESATIVRDAFTEAGVPFTTESVTIAQCPVVHSPAVYVFIGEKP